MSISIESQLSSSKEHVVIEGATVRLAGDSGDGMQLAGTQLTGTSAQLGNDVATFPDFPAEIRAPRGTLAGVSGFQVHFSSQDIFTPGDTLNALVAMNPAALKTNLADLQSRGILIVNEDAFDKKDLEKAGYASNPLEDESLEGYQLFKVPMTKLTRDAIDGSGLSVKEGDKCRNFFAMGLLYWLYGRGMEPTLGFIEEKFGGKPNVAEANRSALNTGWNYGETTDAFASSYKVEPAKLTPGKYKNMMGNQALAWGLMAAAKMSGKSLFFGTYPITPASDILHELSRHKNFGVRTVQAEDEIAAMCTAIGAAFAGEMAVTSSSGPGICLKGEAMGLGMILELPMIIINVQRGGPSTGLPTKTEQSDLLQAMFGRNGESPLPVIAPCCPSDCFDVAQEAWRIAVRFMTPVILLTDGYIANGSEPWLIPDANDLSKIEIVHPGPLENGEEFLPYTRNERLARPWAIPGTPGLMHRVGGLEKQDGTGNVSYDPDNHQHMTNTRAQKVANVADDIPLQEVSGADSGDLLVLSWGGTYGACTTAVRQCQDQGLSVAHAHLRYLNPFPKNLGEILDRYQKILVPELNMGQLRMLIGSQFVKETIGFNKVQGKPFSVSELVRTIQETIR
ncbi:MAG: 2-oxoglutarate ferredoxin oxidoreductase subunit alpha [Planctomycetaceae bacterium]|nr:2-oxoglutarate ferredoxin oxidoreductase subunit alpha [Planctomycetaceae bacterium]